MQVNVGEDEPEDIAVRKFMKKVTDSKLIEQVRGLAIWLPGPGLTGAARLPGPEVRLSAAMTLP